MYIEYDSRISCNVNVYIFCLYIIRIYNRKRCALVTAAVVSVAC